MRSQSKVDYRETLFFVRFNTGGILRERFRPKTSYHVILSGGPPAHSVLGTSKWCTIQRNVHEGHCITGPIYPLQHNLATPRQAYNEATLLPFWLLHNQCRSITHIVDQPGGSSSYSVCYTRTSVILHARPNESDVWLFHAWYLARIKCRYVNSRPHGERTTKVAKRILTCTMSENEETLIYIIYSKHIYYI